MRTLASDQTLGSYLLRVRLTQSARGESWVGERNGELFTLRVSPPDTVDDHEIGRMLAMTRRLEGVEHPSVACLRDLVWHDGTIVVVTDLIQGVSLRKVVRWGQQHGVRLPAALAGHLATTYADALASLHEATDGEGRPRPSVHGALHLRSLRLSYDGPPKLGDVGLPESLSVAQPPRFVAPEVLAGGERGPRSDIYALAVALHDVVTGSALFAGHAPEALLRRSGSVPRLQRSAPEVDRRFDTVLRACLHSDPHRRPSSARVLAQALPVREADDAMLNAIAQAVGKRAPQAPLLELGLRPMLARPAASDPPSGVHPTLAPPSITPPPPRRQSGVVARGDAKPRDRKSTPFVESSSKFRSFPPPREMQGGAQDAAGKKRR